MTNKNNGFRVRFFIASRPKPIITKDFKEFPEAARYAKTMRNTCGSGWKLSYENFPILSAGWEDSHGALCAIDPND
jgi:hypothetical protein